MVWRVEGGGRGEELWVKEEEGAGNREEEKKGREKGKEGEKEVKIMEEMKEEKTRRGGLGGSGKKGRWRRSGWMEREVEVSERDSE